MILSHISLALLSCMTLMNFDLDGLPNKALTTLALISYVYLSIGSVGIDIEYSYLFSTISQALVPSD